LYRVHYALRHPQSLQAVIELVLAARTAGRNRTRAAGGNIAQLALLNALGEPAVAEAKRPTAAAATVGFLVLNQA
jgi:hypothetical protein